MPPTPQVPTAVTVGHATGFAAVGLAVAAQLAGLFACAGWLLRLYRPVEFVGLHFGESASVWVLVLAAALVSTALSAAGCWLELGQQVGPRQFSGAALLNLIGLSLGSFEIIGLAAAGVVLSLAGAFR